MTDFIITNIMKLCPVNARAHTDPKPTGGLREVLSSLQRKTSAQHFLLILLYVIKGLMRNYKIPDELWLRLGATELS